MTDYSPLSLSTGRDGVKRGSFTYEGHEVRVAVQATDGGRYNLVRACSDTHAAFGRVLGAVGVLRQEGVGRYHLSQSGGADAGYVDRGTVADLAERLVRYAATSKVG